MIYFVKIGLFLNIKIFHPNTRRTIIRLYTTPLINSTIDILEAHKINLIMNILNSKQYSIINKYINHIVPNL
jgi:hypothetical protein